jgi:probable rRNA maturation factor
VSLDLDVSFAARRPWVPRRGQFRHWAQAALETRAGAGAQAAANERYALSVRVVGTAQSRRLNAHYRLKDKPTNVLSFAGVGLAPDGCHYLGELVICAPVVAREAQSAGKAREAHWAHMTVHGVLHLRGFDHERPSEARKMASMEIQTLDRLGFSDPYA